MGHMVIDHACFSLEMSALRIMGVLFKPFLICQYSLHLRTPDNVRPWQSYRASFTASSEWKTIDLPFVVFPPYRVEAPLDTSRLLRIGLVAIGRAFYADLGVSEVSFY